MNRVSCGAKSGGGPAVFRRLSAPFSRCFAQTGGESVRFGLGLGLVRLRFAHFRGGFGRSGDRFAQFGRSLAMCSACFALSHRCLSLGGTRFARFLAFFAQGSPRASSGFRRFARASDRRGRSCGKTPRVRDRSAGFHPCFFRRPSSAAAFQQRKEF